MQGPWSVSLEIVRDVAQTNVMRDSLVVRRAVGRGGVDSAGDFTFMAGLLICALMLSGDDVLLE